MPKGLNKRNAMIDNANPLKEYKNSLGSDLLGGISVAALSIPVGIAYAEIAGLPPESGLYTAIFALVAYFFLGSSKQVIIGPDSATVTLFATTVVAASSSIPGSTPQFMVLITVMTGMLMFVAGVLKLGFISNFLSKPILLGYLNGVSVVLIVGQLGKVTGLSIESDGVFARIAELLEKAGLINLPTLLLGLGSILFLYFAKKVSVKIPSQLLLMILMAIAARFFDLGSLGITFMRKVENPYPSFAVPDLNLLVNHFPEILIASAAIMFVSFSGEIPVVQAFSKDKKGFDPNKEFYALGAADVLIGLFKGYPVSGADSRTAANVAVGGKTKLVNLVAAFLMLMVVLFIPGVFATIPLVTFGAIIVFAGMGMFARGAGLGLFRSDKREFLVFAVCALGVLTLGVYQGILFALVLSFLQLIKRSSKPEEYELVYDKENTSAAEYVADSGPAPDPKALIYRFNSALLFYNVNYFSQRLLSRADAKPDLELIVIDARPINIIDLTAVLELGQLIRDFNANDVRLVFAGANASFRSSVVEELEGRNANTDIFYPSIHSVFA